MKKKGKQKRLFAATQPFQGNVEKGKTRHCKRAHSTLSPALLTFVCFYGIYYLIWFPQVVLSALIGKKNASFSFFAPFFSLRYCSSPSYSVGKQWL